MKLGAKLFVWVGATVTLASVALAAAQGLPAYTVYYLGGACGLSILIGGRSAT
jgi:hypothetical protein